MGSKQVVTLARSLSIKLLNIFPSNIQSNINLNINSSIVKYVQHQN
jgi:hypothetical protein